MHCEEPKNITKWQKKKNLPMTFTLKNVVKFGDKVKSEIMMNYFWEMLNWWKWIEPYF